MKTYIMRIGTSKAYYPKITHIFGIGHYKPKELGEDEFSKKAIFFYKYGNDLDFFLDQLIDLFRLRFENDSIKFDVITLYPTSKKDGINKNMETLIKRFSESINLPYRQIIRRIKDIRQNHTLKAFEERVANIQGSIEIIEDIKEKNVIILDNACTTGISLIDAANLLLDKGAHHVACICLGLNCKEKDSDYADLNKTLKYSKISTIFKTQFVPKEKREQWKIQQKQ